MVIQVRCCCDAHLIGYMQGERFERGHAYSFYVPPELWITAGETSVVQGERLEFVCLDFNDFKTGERGLALRSRDYPLEKLRKIRAFRPVE